MPASVLERFAARPPQIEHVSGRVLAGEAVLTGGYLLTWRAALPGGLFLPVAWELTGADTRLGGEVRLVPGGGELRGVQGRAGPGLLALFGTLVCDSSASVDIARLAWRGDRAAAAGTVEIREGACARAGQSAPLPALRIDLATRGDDAVAEVVRRDDGTRLGEIAVTGARTVDLRLEPAGAALVPGLPSGGPIELSWPF